MSEVPSNPTAAGWTGESFDVRVGGPAHGGFCVARHEGRVIFVRHTLPGERVRVRITDDPGKRFCRGEAVEVLEASPDRIDPLCPIAGPGRAGCCDFSHVDPAALRDLKATVVREQLSRLAGIDLPVEVRPVGSGEPTGWRTRTRLAVDAEGRAGVRGFRSERVVTDGMCAQGVPGATAGLGDQRFTPRAHLQVVVDSTGTRHVLHLQPPPTSRPGSGRTRRSREAGRRAATSARTAAAREHTVEVLEGTGRATEVVGAHSWEVDAAGFWQAHRHAPTVYSDVVAEWAEVHAGATAWDLYCGAGLFAARLAEQVGRTGTVWGLESSASAVRDGSAALAAHPAVTLTAGRVERVLRAGASLPTERRPEVVVLDPPRSGAGREVVRALTAVGPEHIVHIGCDPAVFARDAGDYAAGGYRLARLAGFDAFPMTHHVEVVGLFVR